MTDTTSPPVAGRGLPVATLIAGCLAVCLAQTGLAIPATLNGLFQTDLDTTGSQLTWISSATLLPVAVLGLTFGVFGDLFGRKRLLIGGALLMAAGEAASAAANSVHLLWAGQALVGVGAAAIFPSSLAMIAVGTRTNRQRATAIAAWSASLAGGGFVAPLLGGITANYGSWRWALIIVAMIGVVTAAVGFIAQDSSAPLGRSLDVKGQLAIAIGLFALLYAVIQGPSDGWDSAGVVLGFLVAAVFLTLFIVVEMRSRAPLLQLHLFKHRAFALSSVVAVVGMFSFIGTCYALSIRLGPIQHQSPLRTSVAFLLTNGPTMVLAPITAVLLARVAARWLLSSGFLLIAVGDVLLARLSITDRALPSLIVPLILVGMGFTLAVSSITATAVNTVPVRLAGMASATTSQLRDLGFTLGPAVIGAIALSRAASEFGNSLATSPLPEGVKAAAGQVAAAGGPLAVNSLPPQSPPGGAVPLALDALGHGYSVGFVVCACAALVSCLLAGLVLRGGRPKVNLAESEVEDTSPEPAAA
ncbi:MFS transporter [Streptomyces sp. NPDC087263]|uniref:MFS transporter n=1 Tax=Streptomyces sp. NPDC087263 TaxID=3365773 RepID=UPI00380DDA2A